LRLKTSAVHLESAVFKPSDLRNGETDPRADILEGPQL